MQDLPRSGSAGHSAGEGGGVGGVTFAPRASHTAPRCDHQMRPGLGWAGRPGPDVFHEPRSLETALPRLRLCSVATRKRSAGTWPSEPRPHRERPLSADRAEKRPRRVFGPCAMPAFDACRNRGRAPRVPARPAQLPAQGLISATASDFSFITRALDACGNRA